MTSSTLFLYLHRMKSLEGTAEVFFFCFFFFQKTSQWRMIDERLVSMLNKQPVRQRRESLHLNCSITTWRARPQLCHHASHVLLLSTWTLVSAHEYNQSVFSAHKSLHPGCGSRCGSTKLGAFFDHFWCSEGWIVFNAEPPSCAGL